MKNFFMMLEEIWVAAAFAEASVYDSQLITKARPVYRESAHLHIAP